MYAEVVKKPPVWPSKINCKSCQQVVKLSKNTDHVIYSTYSKKVQKTTQNTKKDFWSLLELQVKGMSIQ